MKYIYILENEKKFRDEMIEAIRKIDSQLMVRYFESLEEFAKWIKLLMSEGTESLPKGGTAPDGQDESSGAGPHQLLLVISKNEFLGAKNMSLLRKTRDLFIKQGVCTKEDPTSLVLSGFESPDFDIKLVEDRIINNVIYKPFDKLILQQHLTFAIGGRHPASQYSVHNMKTTTTIEMLKGVEIEAISDIGFISISNRPLAPGVLAKYYSPVFNSLKQRSMMALCLRCDPHPTRPDHFRCAFTYLAADSFQISNIRKEVRKKDLPAFPFEWLEKSPAAASDSLGVVAKPIVDIALISKEEEVISSFKDQLENKFHNAKVHHFASLQEFMYAVDPELAKKDKKENVYDKLPVVPRTLHAIFADESLFEEGFKERWQNIMETVQKKLQAPASNRSGKTDVYALSKKPFSDTEERAIGALVKDIFFLPLDGLYLTKKLTLFMPLLSPQEELSLPTVTYSHGAKAATPIEISEFSEAGLVMKYYRPISTGAFREFVLWLPHELDLPEFLATCNYNEQSKSDKEVYYNHFVFFGMTDHFLKHIRRWILQNHVQSKEADGA
ncbi:hypothetical protein [Bdellovibrio sp. HCB337]|uniref:hypothetical protein n=1 Tax=Bdellovibrio sp. HCB337 TaxID=3394358 RepID=UPI0039A661E4